MTVRPLLIAFDVFSISVVFIVSDTKNRIRKIQISDRHGAELENVELADTPQAHGIRLEKVLRVRFPLFVKVTDGQGKLHDPDDPGPVFPSPTDTEYKAGVPLPNAAVDILNDPEIRSLRATFVLGRSKAKAHDRRRTMLLDQLSAVQSNMALPVIIASVFAAATLIIASSEVVRPWPLAIAIAGVLFISLAVLQAERRARRLDRELQEASSRRADDLVEHDRAVQRLQELGIYGRIVSATTGACSCDD